MMDDPYEIREDGQFVVVTWPGTLYHRQLPRHEAALRDLIRGAIPVVFDFTASRIVGTRWLRLAHRLSIDADEMGKQLAVVGLSQDLREKADLIAILADLHVYDSIAEVPRT